MAWVVDTCLLIDVLDEDPSFGLASAKLLEAHALEGLVLCPVSYAELSPAFQGDLALQDEFLLGVGLDFRVEWSWNDTLLAHSSWNASVRLKRVGKLRKRPLADILIGAFSSRFAGLLTRNPGDFSSAIFPGLTVSTPSLGQSI